MSRERPIISVRVDVTPQWVTPPTGSIAEQIGRAEAEARFAALGHEIAKWLEVSLNELAEEDLASASHNLRMKMIERMSR